jgi:hypothetical protein
VYMFGRTNERAVVDSRAVVETMGERADHAGH